MDISCGVDPCPVILKSTCVFYTGSQLSYIGVTTNDNLQTVIEKINQTFQNTGIGYVFSNGLIQPDPSEPVQLGGALSNNTTIGGAYTLTFVGNVEAAKHITTGGTASKFVKGDGSLDSISYQPSGNYLTSLSGDGVANGPGVGTLVLATVNYSPGTFGNGSTIPIITVNSKGLVTSVTPTSVIIPPQPLLFIGDVVGSGETGSAVTLSLQNVNANVYNTDTVLKFAVNAKGLVTSASPVTQADINSSLGYTPVPDSRTITINGVTYNLSANRSWTVGNVRTDQTYADPIWISSLSWSKIITTPTTLSGYGITDALNTSATAQTKSGTLTALQFIKSGGTFSEFLKADGSVDSIVYAPLNSPVFTGSVTLPGTPLNPLDAATKQYVDEVAEGLKVKPAVQIATTGNLSANYNNGVSGVGATLTGTSNGAFPEIDGVTLTSIVPGTNGVLVKNQSASLQNGRYNLTRLGNSGEPWILTRCGLCDQSSEVPGMYVFVKDGTVGEGTGWVAVVSDPSTFVIGVDPISFIQFSGAGTYTAGNGLLLSGTQFSINTAITVDLNTVQTLTNKTITGSFTGSLSGNADTVTNGVYTTGFYSDPTWISGLAWSKISGTPTTLSGYGITDAQPTLTLTTIGSTGASTLIGATLNIPNYTLSGLGGIGGTISSGQVAFGSGTNTISGENNLWWDSANNRLGIGTTTPTQELDVVGNIRMINNVQYPTFIVGRTSTRYAQLTWDDVAGEGLFQTFSKAFPFTFDASAIKFMTTNTVRMRIFETTGNVLIQNGGTFTNAGFRLDVNGTARIQNQFTTMGSINASGSIARGTYFNQTLIATANNDVLVGLDIVPTFNTGAFTGVSSVALRVSGAIIPLGSQPNIGSNTNAFGTVVTRNLRSDVDLTLGSGYGTTGDGGLRMFSTTRNIIIQNGGTFTDSGFRLDVNGTVRIQGTTTITPPALTGSEATSALDISQTWNTTGTPTVIKLNITDTASNSASKLLDIQVDGTSKLIFAKNGQLFFGVFNNSSSIAEDDTLKGLIFRTSLTNNAGNGFLFSNLQGLINNLSSISNGLSIQPAGSTGFTPISGTGIYNSVNISDRINQTGTANGITRGLYINPTLTSAFDFRAMEWSNNTGWGLYGVGTAPNYLNGRLGLGTTGTGTSTFRNQLQITGGTTSWGILSFQTIQSDVTATAAIFHSEPSTQATSFTLNTLRHFVAVQGTFGLGSSVNTQVGFWAHSSLTGATNNFGFYGDIASGTGRWNLYMNGTALNYLNGSLLVGTTTDAGFRLDVNGTARITPPVNSTALTVSSYSLTGSSAVPAIDISGTWNTTGTPALIRANVTNTASGAASNLIDLRINNQRRFDVSNTGIITLSGLLTIRSTSGTFDLRSGLLNVAGTEFDFSNGQTGNNKTTTSGITNIISTQIGLSPTSGTAVLNGFVYNGTINQTGGANGITRGLLISPTLTSAADWRSIEWSNNTDWGLYGAGTANNYLNGNLLLGTIINNGSKLQVNGNITSTTYNSYIPLPTTATSTTGVVISFITDSVYGSVSTPETGNITANVTGGQLGVTNIIIHNSGTVPTFGSEFKKLTGSGNYLISNVNYIFCTYITSTEIIYSINQRT